MWASSRMEGETATNSMKGLSGNKYRRLEGRKGGKGVIAAVPSASDQ